jgi:hypothetical protein
VDGRGVPLSLVVTGANKHDVTQLDAVLQAIMVKRKTPSIRRSKHLCADAAAAIIAFRKVKLTVNIIYGSLLSLAAECRPAASDYA